MPSLHLQIQRYVDDSFPGWVECQLIDAEGREHLFVEKVPVVTDVDLDAGSSYPQPTFVECTLIARSLRSDGRDIVTVDTDKPWGIESTAGVSQFEVFPEQVLGLEAPAVGASILE